MSDVTPHAAPDVAMKALEAKFDMIVTMFENQMKRNAELEGQIAVLVAASDPEEQGLDPEAWEKKRKSRVVQPPPPRRPPLPPSEVVHEMREIDSAPIRNALETYPQIPDLMLDIIETPELAQLSVANSLGVPGITLAKDLALYVKNRWEDNPKGTLELLRGKRDKETREIDRPGPLDDLYAAVRRAA